MRISARAAACWGRGLRVRSGCVLGAGCVGVRTLDAQHVLGRRGVHAVCVNRRAGSSTRTTDKPGHPPGFFSERAGTANTIGCVACAAGTFDDDVFYLFLQKQKIGAELHIYLEEGTYHKRLFRGPNTNDMKK